MTFLLAAAAAAAAAAITGTGLQHALPVMYALSICNMTAFQSRI